MMQAALEEPERACLLVKARAMVDGVRAITKCPAAARASTAVRGGQAEANGGSVPARYGPRGAGGDAAIGLEVKRVHNPGAEMSCMRWWGL